jgi:hypothetical protein
MRHSGRTTRSVPRGATDEEKSRDRGLGGSMDKKHFYCVGSHSGVVQNQPFLGYRGRAEAAGL